MNSGARKKRARALRPLVGGVVLTVAAFFASQLTGPETGAGSGGGCIGAKGAGRVGAVAPKSAAETPAG